MRKLLINALIILVASLLFNTAGIAFRVYLSNKIGTEGIGLYQLILSVYMMAILFVVSGVNVAVTRLVAEEGGRASFSISRALIIRALTVSFLFSIPAFLFLYFGAEIIGKDWLGDPRTIFSLKLLAVGMPFAGVSACIKGYLYAVGKIARTVSSQVVELAIQIYIIVSILDYFLAGGVEYACAAIAVGLTIAEVASCIYILTIYRLVQKKNDNKISEIYYQKRILRKLLYISFPISANALIRTSFRALENIMIPIGFERYGYTKKISLEEYGRMQGMIMPVLLFPASVILAFSSLLIPELSEANALKQKKRVDDSVSRALQLTSVMSILISGLFFFFSETLVPAIYEGAEFGPMMQMMAPLVPLIYLGIIVDELLHGLDQQVSALKYNTADAVIRIVLIFYLLPIKGMTGLILVMYISNLFGTAICMHRLLIITQLRLKVMNWILKPVLAVAASGFLTVILLDVTGINDLSDIIYILIGALLTGIFYFFFLIRLGGLTGSDIQWFRNFLKYPTV